MEDFSKLVYVTYNVNDDNVDDDNVDDDIVEKLAAVTFNAEFKKPQNPPKDPVGQLFAGMEKTFGDVFHRTADQESCLARFEMFGFYIIPKENFVEVYKVDICIGEVSKVYKGETALSIKDGFNRIMYNILIQQK